MNKAASAVCLHLYSRKEIREIKFMYFEKATKIQQNLQTVLMLQGNKYLDI